MENYTISKESVLALAVTSQTARLILTENFPDAFKEELEVGKWYKSTADIEFLICYQGNGINNYGFWQGESYRNNISFGDYWVDECREATDEELEEALIAEAKKRGYKKGVKVTPLYSDGSPYDNSNVKILEDKLSFDEHQNSLDFNNSSYRLFCKGKWAEIIPEETKVISIEKAVKILSKKYGKQVEIK